MKPPIYAIAHEVNYLRAEARLLPEERPVDQGLEEWRPELLSCWQQLQALAKGFEEPHISPDFFTEVASI